MRLSNKTFFSIHGWLGLHAGFLLFVICLSGTVATLSNEVDWLLDSEKRNQVFEGQAEEQTFAQIYNSVRREYPHAGIGGLLIVKPPETYLPIQVLLAEPGTGDRTLYVDRYTGAVLAERDLLTVKRFFRIFHKQFLIVSTPYSFHGLYIVGVFGLFLLSSVISGLLFLGNWLKKLTCLRWHKGLRVFLIDWHRSSGLWALVFSLIMASTGFWYWIEIVADLSEVFLVQENTVDYASYGHHLPAPDVELYVNKAEKALEGLKVQAIRLPDKPDGVVHVFGQADAWLVRDAANYVALDPYSGDVLYRQAGTELGLLDRWLHTVDPIHFGSFASLLSKTIWFIFGFTLTVSIPVGAGLWYLRSKERYSSQNQFKTRSLIAANTLTFIVLAMGTVFSIAGINRMQSEAGHSHAMSYGSHAIGPWQVIVKQFVSKADIPGKFTLQFKRPRPNFKHATIQFEGPENNYSFDFKRAWHAIEASPKTPQLRTNEGATLLAGEFENWIKQWDSIKLKLEAHDGRSFSYRLSKKDILRGVNRATEIDSPRSHRPTMAFVVSFLGLVWAMFFIWLFAQNYVFRVRRFTSLETQLA